MKKTVFLALFSSCVAINSSADQHKHCDAHTKQCSGHQCMHSKKFDTNNDGVISQAEFITYHEAKFANMDADGNGELSKDEMRSGQCSKCKMKEKMGGHEKQCGGAERQENLLKEKPQ